MKYFLGFLFLISLISCNLLPEALLASQVDVIDTLDVTEYRYVVDKKNRRGYVTKDNEIMDGHYVITRNGKMIEEFDVSKGFLQGQLIRFDENEQPEALETYKTSVQHGPVLTYHKNGILRSEGSFTNGEEDTEKIFYDSEGTVEQEIVVKDGIVYTHQYYLGNRMLSDFEKTIDGKRYRMVRKYDAFGTTRLIMGKEIGVETPVFYIFDTDFKEIDRFNSAEEITKSREYFSLLQAM